MDINPGTIVMSVLTRLTIYKKIRTLFDYSCLPWLIQVINCGTSRLQLNYKRLLKILSELESGLFSSYTDLRRLRNTKKHDFKLRSIYQKLFWLMKINFAMSI